MEKSKSTRSSGGKMEITKGGARDRRTWNENEKKEVLECMLDTIRSGKLIEKPNATAYYEMVLKKMTFNDCTGSQLRNTVNNMKRKYVKAKDWRGKTGQGVLQEEGEESVIAALRKMCPFFDELDEIYWTRSSVTPPTVHDSADLEGERIAVSSHDVHEMENSQSAQDNEGNEKVVTPTSSENCSKGKKRKPSESGIEMLASSAKLRFEIQQGELAYQKDKWEHEKTQQDAQLLLERDRFEFEKEMTERKLLLEEKKQEMEFTLAKYKIEKEVELQLELAKLSHSK